MPTYLRFPVLTDETLSQIMWGMENQDTEYMLNLNDGTLYNAEESEGEVSPECLTSLPTWGSSEGYQLMVSFTNQCQDPKLKERLSNELNQKKPGVFRRFRNVLSEDQENLKRWHEFKDMRMKAHIRSWYRDHFKRQADELDADEMYEGELLLEFEVRDLAELDDYCKNLLKAMGKDNPVLKKILEGFKEKKALEILRDKEPCGAIIFEQVKDHACVLHYYIEEKYREQGLFNLVFDLFNRNMERSGVIRVVIPFESRTPFIRNILRASETTSEQEGGYLFYRVREWNENLASSESAYVL